MGSLHVSNVSVPFQQDHDGGIFPLVYTAGQPTASLGKSATVEDVMRWVKELRTSLLEQVQSHGAILFRGFPLVGPEDFDRFVEAFDLHNFPYEQSLSNAVRINFTPRVFSANEAPSDVTIHLHHEMAQTPIYPHYLLFFCETPADQGGATPLCRSDVLYQQMLKKFPEFVGDCADKGLRYTNVMPADNDAGSGMGRSWQSTFRAANQQEAEKRMRELGYEWEWQPDGCLRATTPVLPAVMEVSPGRHVFFNQLIAAFRGWKDSRNDPTKSIKFGDGTSLDAQTVNQVADLAEDLTFDLAWQRGDVALVNNCVVMHARRAFQGTRKVLASLTEARHHEIA